MRLRPAAMTVEEGAVVGKSGDGDALLPQAQEYLLLVLVVLCGIRSRVMNHTKPLGHRRANAFARGRTFGVLVFGVGEMSYIAMRLYDVAPWYGVAMSSGLLCAGWMCICMSTRSMAMIAHGDSITRGEGRSASTLHPQTRGTSEQPGATARDCVAYLLPA